MSLRPDCFEWIRQLLESEAGHALPPDKQYLVESRLEPLASRLEMASIDRLIDQARVASSPEWNRQIVESMLIHESMFFRDDRCFETVAAFIRNSFLDQQKSMGHPLLWSAACAGGQEPFSLAMLVHEILGADTGNSGYHVVATDLSQNIIAQARTGEFSELDIRRGLNEERQKKFLRSHGNRWKVDSGIASHIEFRQHNLAESPPPVAMCDVVLMRNVVIYMTDAARDRAFRCVHSALKPNGILLMGSTEAMFPPDRLFQRREDYPMPCFCPIT